MPPDSHRRAWEDWGSVDPLFAILTDPRYRHGGDTETFLQSGEGSVASILAETDRLGLCSQRRTALDFGCGVGRLTWVLARRFDTVLGLDVARSMITKAQSMHGELSNCTFEVHRGDDLRRFSDSSFDLVLCFLVLQHLASTAAIETYLREFVRVLRPRGALIVQLPSNVPAHRAQRPPWRTHLGLRVRVAGLLRAAGVSPGYLYRHLEWAPDMTMLGLPHEDTCRVLEAAGGRVVYATEPEVDSGGTETRIYYVTR